MTSKNVKIALFSAQVKKQTVGLFERRNFLQCKSRRNSGEKEKIEKDETEESELERMEQGGWSYGQLSEPEKLAADDVTV